MKRVSCSRVNFVFLLSGLICGLLRLTALPTSDWSSIEPKEHCPYDDWAAYELAWHPPHPTGAINEITLPNDAVPGTELSLSVAGDKDDRYPLVVAAGGYGGRVLSCTMPVPAHDDSSAMGRLPPQCRLSQPPVMDCMVFDAWLNGAPGGPLHDLLHAAAHASDGNTGERPPDMPVGVAALEAVVELLDAFAVAQRAVDQAQWASDVAAAAVKADEAAAKALADEAKAAARFYGDDWPSAKGMHGTCYERHEAWRNTTAAAEAALKAAGKARAEELKDTLTRLKARRAALTEFPDGRFPGGSVEVLGVNTRDVWGRTPLHWAAARGQDLLLGGGGGAEGGAAENADVATGTAAAAAAAMAEAWVWAVEALIDRGGEPNICDADGRTPLDLAIASGNAGAVRALLNAGAGSAWTNRWGQTGPEQVSNHAVASASAARQQQQQQQPQQQHAEVRAALGLPPSSRRGGRRRGSGGGGNETEEGEEDVGLLDYLAEVASGGVM